MWYLGNLVTGNLGIIIYITYPIESHRKSSKFEFEIFLFSPIINSIFV